MHENGRNARLLLEATVAKLEQKLDVLLKATAAFGMRTFGSTGER